MLDVKGPILTRKKYYYKSEWNVLLYFANMKHNSAIRDEGDVQHMTVRCQGHLILSEWYSPN